MAFVAVACIYLSCYSLSHLWNDSRSQGSRRLLLCERVSEERIELLIVEE